MCGTVVMGGGGLVLRLKNLSKATFVPRRQLAISRDIFGCNNLWGSSAPEHPTVPKAIHGKELSSPKCQNYLGLQGNLGT